MTELDYFDSLLDVIEKGLPFKAEEEVDRIESSRLTMENLIRMRLVADLQTMVDEQPALKIRCCKLLLRTYELVAQKSEKKLDHGKILMRNIILLSMTKQLEELFYFLVNYTKLPMEDL